jgi:hypothetical protein
VDPGFPRGDGECVDPRSRFSANNEGPLKLIKRDQWPYIWIVESNHWREPVVDETDCGDTDR